MKEYGDLDLYDFATYHFANYKRQNDLFIDDASCRLKLGDSRTPSDSADSDYTISFDKDKGYPTSH